MSPQKNLPEGFFPVLHLDLQHDRKLNLHITAFSLVIIILMGAAGNWLQPIGSYLQKDFRQIAYLFLGLLLYMMLHELIHGIFMLAFSGVRPHYGFVGIYSYAGCEVYFDRFRYVLISLAPIVIWGIVLGLLCRETIRSEWFWTFYILEIFNLSSAAGDLYVWAKFSRIRREILILDQGSTMTVYAKQ